MGLNFNGSTVFDGMAANWLQTYLRAVVKKDLCTKIRCTTCGALEFRRGVFDALAIATDREIQPPYDRGSVLEVVRAIADIDRPQDSSRKVEDAVRCLLAEFWTGVPFVDNETVEMLGESWPGQIMREMRAHHEAVQENRRREAEYNSPENIQKRRDEKKRIRQEQHQERLKLKVERDRIWRATQIGSALEKGK
jgi:hypothetical protein